MVRLISKTFVNWNNLVQAFKDCTGTALPLKFDANSAHRLIHFLHFFKEMSGTSLYSQNSLKHIHCSFMLRVNHFDALTIATQTDLQILIRHTREGAPILILTGDLVVWTDALAVCCSESASQELREQFRNVFAIFMEEGLTDLLSDYTWKTTQLTLLP